MYNVKSAVRMDIDREVPQILYTRDHPIPGSLTSTGLWSEESCKYIQRESGILRDILSA